jgi:hypothetical protein
MMMSVVLILSCSGAIEHVKMKLAKHSTTRIAFIELLRRQMMQPRQHWTCVVM